MTPLKILEPVILQMTVASFLAFALAMLLTPVYTHLAFKYQAWKKVRSTATTGEKAPIFHKLHAAKHRRNIPTMAGIIMVIAITYVTVVLNLSREQTYLPLFAIVAAGTVGLIDDLINIRGLNRGIAGLRTRLKFLLILAIATAASFYAYFTLDYATLAVPFFGEVYVGPLLIPIFILVIVSTANAVNITDGLDGLAGGLLSIAFGTYGLIAMLQGNHGIAIFCATVVGALLSYTWFNIHPARFFMGDTGSFALGTGLGIIALLTDTVLLLPIIGGIFVVEAGSSGLQILSKKFRGKKIFLSAPIHHHFEAIGWPETKVTMRFWILGAVLGALGMIVAVVGGQL